MPPESEHTYGNECRLAPAPQPEAPRDLDGIPPLHAHFFYSSLIPIDDPLSTVSIPGATDPRSSRVILRPFSPGDSNTLEKAWLGLASEGHQRDHLRAQRARSSRQPLSQPDRERLDGIIQRQASRHRHIHGLEGWPTPSESVPSLSGPLPETGFAPCCQELPNDISAELSKEFCALFRKQQPELDELDVCQGVLSKLQRPRSAAEPAVDATHLNLIKSFDRRLSEPRTPNPFSSEVSASTSAPKSSTWTPIPIRNDEAGRTDSNRRSRQTVATRSIPIKPPVMDDGISGKPFVRVGTGDSFQFSPPVSLSPFSASLDDKSPARSSHRDESREDGARPRTSMKHRPAETEHGVANSIDIAVGISRLHMVSLPILRMKPIYWSPVNDVSIVLRATWFYK